MNKKIIIRKATVTDIDFLTEAVIQAEKGHGNKVSYCALFGISEMELKDVLKQIFLEEINHFEFSIAGFMIAEIGGERAGTYSAWVEGAGGLPSGMLKMSAFKSFLSNEQLRNYDKQVRIVEEIGFPRKHGTFQFESLFIREKFRGENIGNHLVEGLVDGLAMENPDIEVAQVQIIAENTASLKAHFRYGFKILDQKSTQNPEIYRFFSGNTRILMEKQIR